MGLLSNRISVEHLQEGDHIYSWRAGYSYSHHGIFVGDNRVIHFTRGRNREIGTNTILDSFFSSSTPPLAPSAPCPDCGCSGDSHGVILSCLQCFLAGFELYRFAYGVKRSFFLAKLRGGTCTMAACDDPATVLHRANYLLEKGFGKYHLFENNCEDFALYCKTGLLVLDKSKVGGSSQCISMMGLPAAVIASSPFRSMMTSSPLGMIALAGGIYCATRYSCDLAVRKDSLRVEVEDLAYNLQLANHELLNDSIMSRMLN